MTTATQEATGVQLRPLEVTINMELLYLEELMVDCQKCGTDISIDDDLLRAGAMDALWDELRRRGIDTGRPVLLHVDPVSGLATARQDPWEG